MRFVDEEALRVILDICERPCSYGLQNDSVAVAFIEGYLMDKCYYRLEERLHQRLGLPSNSVLFATIRNLIELNELPRPLELLEEVVREILSEKDYCVSCGLVIRENELIQITNCVCDIRFPTYGVRLVHGRCCVNADWPTTWTRCHLCQQTMDRSQVGSAVDILVRNLNQPGSQRFDQCCFMLVRLSEETYWQKIFKSVESKPTYGERFRAAKFANEEATKQAYVSFESVPEKVRKAFVPVHVKCSDALRLQDDLSISDGTTQ